MWLFSTVVGFRVGGFVLCATGTTQAIPGKILPSWPTSQVCLGRATRFCVRGLPPAGFSAFRHAGCVSPAPCVHQAVCPGAMAYHAGGIPVCVIYTVCGDFATGKYCLVDNVLCLVYINGMDTPVGIIRHRARMRVHYAIRKGRLIRPASCQECGATAKLDAHHPDYSLPLIVVFLCKPCHTKKRK